nr:RNA-directed DNA polymerase, eukaryota [Tanacetum cinerariifolium]
MDINDVVKVADSIEDNSIDDWNDMNTKFNELDQDFNDDEDPMINMTNTLLKQPEVLKEEEVNKDQVSNHVVETSDPNRPPGYEHINRGLIDLPIGGCYYTWMNIAGAKFSKFDCFLIYEDILDALPDIRITTLDSLWSDHTPILLHVLKSDFSPSSFKLYNSWLLRDGFDEAIKSSWSSLETNSNGCSIKSHVKLHSLKSTIKQ